MSKRSKNSKRNQKHRSQLQRVRERCQRGTAFTRLMGEKKERASEPRPKAEDAATSEPETTPIPKEPKKRKRYSKMSFGKFAGKPIDQIPESYLRWLLTIEPKTKRVERNIRDAAKFLGVECPHMNWKESRELDRELRNIVG